MRYQQQRYSRLIPGEKKNRAGNNLKPERIVEIEVSPAEPVVRGRWGLTLLSSGREMGGLTTQGPRSRLRLGAELRVLEKTSLQ